MGAITFMALGRGTTASQAFIAAREHAAWEHGHGGYTGTIAEKTSFTMIDATFERNDCRVGKKVAYDKARELIDNGDTRVDDKWGPAGCIALGNDEWLFFGWASS